MSHPRFSIGFWHPFGAHSGESREAILRRKAAEATKCGWTLWTFRHRTDATLGLWAKELARAGDGPVYALCSDSPGSADPVRPGQRSQVVNCGWCRPPGSAVWFPVPKGVKARHALKPGQQATAFVVRRVHLAAVPPLKVQWLTIDTGKWCGDRLPTRGECLVRRGGKAKTGPACAVLELAAPFVVSVRP